MITLLRPWAVLSVLSAILAGCGTTQTAEGCGRPELAPEDRVAACTDAIEASDGRARAAAFNNRGIAYRELGEFQRAIRDFDRAARADPQFQAAYANAGQSRNATGQYQRAITDLGRALVLDPQDVGSRRERGTAYSELGQHALARQDYDAAIRLDPADAALFTGRAWNAYREGADLRAALADADQALRLDPALTEAIDVRAHVLAALGRVEEAIADFEQAVIRGGGAWAFGYERALAGHGHDPGPVDGAFDDAARRALRACLEARCRLLG